MKTAHVSFSSAHVSFSSAHVSFSSASVTIIFSWFSFFLVYKFIAFLNKKMSFGKTRELKCRFLTRPGFDPRSRHIFWRPWIFLSPLWPQTSTGFPLQLVYVSPTLRARSWIAMEFFFVFYSPARIQPGAVKLVLWRHWMHATQVHPVMSENHFHCTRLCVC